MPFSAPLSNGSATFTITGPNAGDHSLSATYATQGDFAAGSATGNLHVNPRPISITADAKSKTYGDADPTLTYQIASGSLVTGDTFTGSLTRAGGEAEGMYAIQQGTLALSANYALTFTGANLTITLSPLTVTAVTQTKLYGEVDPPLTYHTSGLKLNDTAVTALTGALVRTSGENVGQYAINQGTLTGSNYTINFTGNNLTITPAPLSISANGHTKIYGAADPALTYQASGLKLNDTAATAVAGALTRTPGENVGSYAITQGTLAATNYTISFTGNALAITQAPLSVTATPQSKVYGAADPALTYRANGFQFGDTVATALRGGLTRASGENVGPYAITQGTLAATNYAINFTSNTLTITAQPVTVTAEAKAKVYGTADPALTYKITTGSLVNGDSFSGTLTRSAGEDAGRYAILQGNLTTSTNYSLTYLGANLTISPAPTATALSSAPGPSMFGQGVLFTATVSRTIPRTGIPPGIVTFYDGAVAIGTGTLNASGVATFGTSSLLAGAHAVTAAYGATNNFSVSTSPADTQTVNKANTSTVLASSLNPSNAGTAVTFIASVSAVLPGTGIPTGTITFRDGNTVLASATVNGLGQATLVTSALNLGVRAITATYSGDANFTTSSSGPLSQIIYAYPAGAAGGTFVIGDQDAVVGRQVTFWGAQWDKLNSLSGGSGPASFKGFADSTSTNPPRAGGSWTARTGNSSEPPDSICIHGSDRLQFDNTIGFSDLG